MSSILAAIILTGLAASDPVPGTYIEVNFAQGDAAGSGSATEVVLMGNKLAAGTAVVDTEVYGPDGLVPMQTEADVIGLFGAGSELHRMWRAFVRVNKTTTVRAIAVTENAGGTAASVSTVLTVPATGSGNIRIVVHDEVVDVGVQSGDALDTIGANMVTAVNLMAHWGVVASYNVATDTFTLAAKQKGPRGNDIRFQIIPSNGIGTQFSAGVTVDSPLASGATPDTNATALQTLSTGHYYYIVSAAGDATQLGALVSQVNVLAAPISGNRQRVIAASSGTLNATTTIATGRNAARAEIAWLEKSPLEPPVLAANHAAVITLFETRPNPRTNFCGFGQDAKTSDFWVVPAPRTKTAWPSRTSIASALNNGITPIGVLANGSTYLVNRITTRSLNGAVNDYRIRAAHKVTICDFFAEDLAVKTSQQCAGKRIMDNPVPGQPVPGPDVIFPTAYKGIILQLINVYEANNLLQNVAEIKAGIKVQREANPRTRMGARVPLQPVDNAEQFAVAIDQVA